MREQFRMPAGWYVSGSNAIPVCITFSIPKFCAFFSTYSGTYCVSNEGRRCSIVCCEYL